MDLVHFSTSTERRARVFLRFLQTVSNEVLNNETNQLTALTSWSSLVLRLTAVCKDNANVFQRMIEMVSCQPTYTIHTQILAQAKVVQV